ncbi:solute carrier family 23 protein [Pseudomonas sp.]|uniref:solute carrier family 23 protein n=1 Tax=Pseudomonas sp. TaxID=306 RepID=UPI003A96998B
MKPTQVHPVDEVLPIRQLFTFGLQHVLVMYAGAVAVPLILGSALGLTSAQVILLINANLLTSGVATLIQTIGFWKFGARLPLIQGCSFIALAPMIMIGKEFGLSQIFGAVIAAGAITIALAPIFSRLLRFFPPVVIGSLITIIGISLMPAAAIWLGGGNPGADDFGSPANLLLGLVTVSITLVVYAKFSGFIGNLSVLIGLILGSLVAAAFGMTNFSRIGEAAWFELSPPMAFGAPEFSLMPILIMTLAMLVIMAETTGNCLAIGKLTGKPTTQQTLAGAFRADGLLHPDLIFMDLSMPQMDGWETSRLIRRNALSQAPIIVLSANAFADDRERSVTSVCNDYLAKPVHTPQLLERIQKQLDLQWLHRASSPVAPLIKPPRLPAACDLEALHELAALGYIRGLQEKFDDIDRQSPDFIGFTAPLRLLVKNFRLDELTRQLKEADHERADITP